MEELALEVVDSTGVLEGRLHPGVGVRVVSVCTTVKATWREQNVVSVCATVKAAWREQNVVSVFTMVRATWREYNIWYLCVPRSEQHGMNKMCSERTSRSVHFHPGPPTPLTQESW